MHITYWSPASTIGRKEKTVFLVVFIHGIIELLYTQNKTVCTIEGKAEVAAYLSMLTLTKLAMKYSASG